LKPSLPFQVPEGVRHMLISTFLFSIMNVFIKLVSARIPAIEIVFFRCLVSGILCLTILYREKVSWVGSNRKLLLARGIFGTIALYTFFETLHKMPLGTAVTIQYLSPIFTTIIAVFFLREGVKSLQWLFFMLSFSGVIVIKGVATGIPTGIIAIGILSALSSGFAYNMVRRLKGKEHYAVIVLHFQIVGVITGFTFSVFNWVMPQGIEWFYLIMIGVATQMAQVRLTKALQSDKIANISILNYLGVLYALLFGFTFFGEHYTLYTMLGIVLVVGGVLLNFLYTAQKAKLVAEEELTTIEE
jgi:drug/metabolite transporter (DMT)-like permease